MPPSKQRSSDQGAAILEAQNAISDAIASIRAAGLSRKSQDLISQLLQSGVKMSAERVVKIWKIAGQRMNSITGLVSEVLWIEEGDAKSGYKHVARNSIGFKNIDINEKELLKVIKAATTVGTIAGEQGTPKENRPARPIFLLLYKNRPIAVAVSIGSNGFIVGLNKVDLDKALRDSPVPIDKIGRYKSDDRMIPSHPHFRGWMYKMPSKESLEERDGGVYVYIKNGVAKSKQTSIPRREWVYCEEGWDSHGDKLRDSDGTLVLWRRYDGDNTRYA